jgi:hypothetical protein
VRPVALGTYDGVLQGSPPDWPIFTGPFSRKLREDEAAPTEAPALQALGLKAARGESESVWVALAAGDGSVSVTLDGALPGVTRVFSVGFVDGVAEVLRRRGRSVAIHAQAPLLLPIDEAEEARAAEIVLVDAGPWFTSGPVRRRTVERAALGCDAAVLVRHADKPPCPAWNEVLTAIGLTVIGEAVTFESALVSG